LEFNVPFQHKYGYIRDDEILRLTRNVGDRAYAMSHLSAVVTGCMSRPYHVP